MKKPIIYLSALFLILPTVSSAQASLQNILTNVPTFLGSTVIPFLFGMAFLIFVFNAIKFFVVEGSTEDGREKAKNLMLYSVTAFVFLIIFWGIVNMLTSSSGLDGQTQPCYDYLKVASSTACP